jgi:methyl-accepting chemotaxis protein
VFQGKIMLEAKATELSAKLAFLQLDAETCTALREFREVAKRHLGGVLEGFYAHVGAIPELRAMLGGGANVARVKDAQTHHWLNLFDAQFDDEYLLMVRRIGDAHYRNKLSPSWYMGGYCFALNALTRLAIRRHRWQPDKLARVVAALNRAVFLDMDLAMGVYNDAVLAEREARQQRLLKLVGDFEGRSTEALSATRAASTQLESTAQGMTSTAEETSHLSTVVTNAAGEASSNVQTVAAAAEELSASINEISRQVTQAAQTAAQAVDEAHRTDDTVKGLADAAQKIGEVVQLINDIASQTNLLALNATIEAARAGEAGKGFAVVASEVKNLANQTAKATEEISTQIAAMQSVTGDAVKAIQGIGQRIGEINEIATAIAGAVEEQGAATREIAGNVQNAATGTQQVSDNIGRVSMAATETGRSAGEVMECSRAVSGQADALSREIADFLTKVQAA